MNNAGILRDKSFLNMTEQDWDLVHRIHLRAAYLLTQAAWPYMRKQNYGKVIFTTSTSGLYGNFGQVRSIVFYQKICERVVFFLILFSPIIALQKWV